MCNVNQRYSYTLGEDPFYRLMMPWWCRRLSDCYWLKTPPLKSPSSLLKARSPGLHQSGDDRSKEKTWENRPITLFEIFIASSRALRSLVSLVIGRILHISAPLLSSLMVSGPQLPLVTRPRNLVWMVPGALADSWPDIEFRAFLVCWLQLNLLKEVFGEVGEAISNAMLTNDIRTLWVKILGYSCNQAFSGAQGKFRVIGAISGPSWCGDSSLAFFGEVGSSRHV